MRNLGKTGYSLLGVVCVLPALALFHGLQEGVDAVQLAGKLKALHRHGIFEYIAVVCGTSVSSIGRLTNNSKKFRPAAP